MCVCVCVVVLLLWSSSSFIYICTEEIYDFFVTDLENEHVSIRSVMKDSEK